MGKPRKRKPKALPMAIEPRRIVFAKRDQFEASKAPAPQGRIRSRQNKRPAKIEHSFWKSQRNPDELCDDILDYPMVVATWGSLCADILQGGIGWKPPPGYENDPKVKRAAKLLNEHDELTAADDQPLTMEASARMVLQTVMRGFLLIERDLAPMNDPVRGGPWSGFRRMTAANWLSRRIVDVEEDEYGRMLRFRERSNGGAVHEREESWAWQRYMPLTWDIHSASGVLYGSGLCVPLYEFTSAARQAQQAWRSIVERLGGGAVVATLDENSSTEFNEIADTTLEMLDNLLTNFIAVLPKGVDLQARDLFAKPAGEVVKALKQAEDQGVQLIVKGEIASTGTDDSGGANSRARTEALIENAGARPNEIAGWLVPRLRQLWRPVVEINIGRVPMPIPVLGGRGLLEEGDGGGSTGAGGDLQKQAMNGAQMQGVMTALTNVSAKLMAPSVVEIFIRGAAPGIFTDDELRTMTKAQAEMPAPAAAPSSPAAPRPEIFNDSTGRWEAIVSAKVRDRVRQAATRKLRRWFEDGKAVDCSRPMPLRTEFKDAYQALGLSPLRADDEAERTCEHFARRLAEVLPQAKTVGGKLRVLSQVADELAEAGRLAEIQERNG